MSAEFINLDGATIIGSGNGRKCYVHPRDPSLVVKVPSSAGVPRRQNELELLYLTSLMRRGVPFNYIPRVYGLADTTRGKGLICERISNPDGRQCVTLMEAVRTGLLDQARTETLLEELRQYLLRYWIVFVDSGDGNLVWQERQHESGRLVIIDGLGGRHPNLRLWLRTHVPWIARWKMRKKWRRLLVKVRACYPCS